MNDDRINYDELANDIIIGLQAGISRLKRERDNDTANLEAHMDATVQTLDRIGLYAEEIVKTLETARTEVLASLDKCISGVRLIESQQRQHEEARLRSLTAHVDDMKSGNGPPRMMETPELKKLRAAE